jgi:hypothetical protein
MDHKHHLHVTDKPLVIRAFVAGGPARSISVGLPGGMNYCFDAGQGQVAFGWSGGFLDVGPDRGRNENDRGGGWCQILGERFEVGTNGFPIRFGDPAKIPNVKFGGYRRVGTPEFYLTADGVNITQVITAAPSGTGLQYEFTLVACRAMSISCFSRTSSSSLPPPAPGRAARSKCPPLKPKNSPSPSLSPDFNAP